MSDGFQFWDILFFALIAIFVILRLRTVLGRRTGNERKPTDIFTRTPEDQRERPGKVVRLPGRGTGAEQAGAPDDILERDQSPRGFGRDEEPANDMDEAPRAGSASQDIRAGFTQIKLTDPSFDARDFAQGARAAYGMIVEAFAKGDTATLRPLLGDEAYDRFSAEVRTRLAAGKTQDTKINDIKSAEIIAARMTGRTAFVIVRFVSRQTSATRAATGEVISGDPDKSVEVVEEWTFSRNTRSSDPNWSLVETRAVA